MLIQDPISDMLTRIRNAQSAKKHDVCMPSTKVLAEIARILKEEGYIASYEVQDTRPAKTLVITLKYGAKGETTIKGIKRISTPGLRKYASVKDLPRVLGGLGTAIISTSHGMMCDRDARKQGVGGEIIAFVW